MKCEDLRPKLVRQTSIRGKLQFVSNLERKTDNSGNGVFGELRSKTVLMGFRLVKFIQIYVKSVTLNDKEWFGFNVTYAQADF